MHRTLALLLALALASVPSFAQTRFEPIADAVRAQPLLLSAEAKVVALNPADKDSPRAVYTVARTFAPDGTITIDWKTDRFQSHQVFRPDGTLLAGRQADTLKGTVLDQTSDPRRTNLKTVLTVQGQTKSDKKADLRPGIVLRDELSLLVVQAWLYGVRDGLTFQSLSPDGGLTGDFQILFKRVVDPTSVSPLYTYPAEFKAALGAKSSYLVADMTLQGVGAFFYPHHFYLLYEVTASGLEWRAYFGEDPKKPVFQFLIKKD
jgi:hypothetical protein